MDDGQFPATLIAWLTAANLVLATALVTMRNHRLAGYPDLRSRRAPGGPRDGRPLTRREERAWSAITRGLRRPGT